MKKISSELYKTLTKKYETEIQEGLSTLLIYFENPVGIGDHSNHLKEMDELISVMSSENDKLKILKETFQKDYCKL